MKPPKIDWDQNENAHILVEKLKNIGYYLVNESITIKGVNFYGSPHSLQDKHGSRYCAFQLNASESPAIYSKIPGKFSLSLILNLIFEKIQMF